MPPAVLARKCLFSSMILTEGHDDAGSHRGYVDAVFCIAKKMNGSAGVGNGEGRVGCWDDVVAVKSIN